MFDITQITPAETTFLHLKSPVDEELLFTGKGDAKKPVGITLHAPGSAGYEAADTARTNRMLVRNKKKLDLTAEQLKADQPEFQASVTISFDELAYPPAGEATGKDLFKALYADPKYSWVRDQVTAHLADWANFTKSSATS